MPAPIIPSYVLEALAQCGDDRLRQVASQTLALDEAFRAGRERPLVPPAETVGTPGSPDRTIRDAGNEETTAGEVVREEGDGPTGDAAADEAYDGLGATYALFWSVFERDSIDGKGLPLQGVVHYGQDYDNAFWDGTQMIFGDGDGIIFNRFTIAVDVIGHELAHGVTEVEAGLVYEDQSGALNESVSDCFGSMVKQYALDQTADAADWLIGAGLLTDGVNGVALRSMRAPGTAYDDERLGGKDPQPAHFDDYVETSDDDGGVHINSGIPNRAFYLAAVALGGNSWDQAGQIWYATLQDDALDRASTFAAFAALTVANAARMYDDDVAATVREAWQQVGVDAGEGARVELRRTGGFAGLRRTARLELDVAEAEALAAALDETGEEPGPATGADRFQYDLTLVRGDERRSLRLREGAIPDALRPLLDRLTQRLS